MNSLFINDVFINRDECDLEDYLFHIDTIQNLNQLHFTKNITFFVGENGTGKSTLLEAIAIAYGFNSEGGTLNYHFSTKDTHSSLHNAIHLSRGYSRPEFGYFLRAETFYNVATMSEEYQSKYLQKYLHQQSHGESFLSFIQSSMDAIGIYLLDEPEAALSPQRQLSLFIQIFEMASQGSQFIIATHSPILLAIPDACIYSFDDGYIHECQYTDTPSYQITKLFLENKDSFIDKLLYQKEEDES